MKTLFTVPVLVTFFIFFTGCKQSTISFSSYHLDEMSRQLEERPGEINNLTKAIHSTDKALPNKAAIAEFKIAGKKNTSAKSTIHTSTVSKNIVNYNGILLDKNQKRKILSPKEFDKDNVFWRIGKIILKVGLTVMGLLGAVSFGVSSNNGFIFSLFGGLLIGLIIMAISIPFFIIGLISELMKNKKSNLENTNEI